jgi:carbamoyltransferase
MKKFTRLVEQVESKRFFRINSELDLIVVASSEGEAGYLADSELGSIENHSEFRIRKLTRICDTIEQDPEFRIEQRTSSLLFKEDIQNSDTLENFKKNFASSTQKIFEFFFDNILNYISKKNFSKNLVYAGGCALNSSANNILVSKKYFENFFIPVAPGDNGGAIGAALLVNSKYNLNQKNFANPYLGSSFNDNEVESAINKDFKNLIKFQKLDDISDTCDLATNMLIEGKVIGWFQGQMEFGPRALGNRSILADPRNPNMKNIINQKIKRRENFRPFAPSVIDKYHNDWFYGDFKNIYMSSTIKVKDIKKKEIPAVIHVDDTSRTQVVTIELNIIFYSLISKFYEKTGVPLLLNTSFNESEPIVNKPEEAINCLLRTGIDGLFINNIFITKF